MKIQIDFTGTDGDATLFIGGKPVWHFSCWNMANKRGIAALFNMGLCEVEFSGCIFGKQFLKRIGD